jgi:transcriptional regulator with GAF, ATPase, and Fis domain
VSADHPIEITSNVKSDGERTNTTISLRDARRAFERDYILNVLQQQGWSIAGTARALGLQRPNLYRKARQLRIALKRNEAVE